MKYNKEIMLNVFLLCILFIFQYDNANASPVRKNSPDNLKTIVLHTEFYPDDFLEEVINEPEYFYEETCPDCDLWEKRSSKRHIDGVRRDEAKVYPKELYLYQNLLRSLNKPKKSYFVPKGWGAGGMPFNVLYTPNFSQQKILRSIPDKVLVTPVTMMYSSVGEPLALTDPKPPLPPPVPLDLKEASKEELTIQKQYTKPIPKTFQKQATSRRHYPSIPQLYLSYGWGPIGK